MHDSKLEDADEAQPAASRPVAPAPVETPASPTLRLGEEGCGAGPTEANRNEQDEPQVVSDDPPDADPSATEPAPPEDAIESPPRSDTTITPADPHPVAELVRSEDEAHTHGEAPAIAPREPISAPDETVADSPESPSAVHRDQDEPAASADIPAELPADPLLASGESEMQAASSGMALTQLATETSAYPLDAPTAGADRPQSWRRRVAVWAPTLRRIARYAALALAGWLALVVVLVAVFRFVDPPGSMLMAIERVGGTPITRSWRDLDQISPELLRAVVASEDARFCEHWGIDLGEIVNAIRRTRDGTPRGASTISMQVAKNLFLWPSKSYLRKALEVPATLMIELLWPKRRVLEVYLNIAEWGPGVFGAEAAARHHFAKTAKRLSGREAALLAVTLPNPTRRSAGKPSRLVARLASLIERRAQTLGRATRCLQP